MSPLFTVTGRDVLFAHWPVAPATLRRRVPDVLAPATFDDSGWVSVLALENGPAGPGRTTVPTAFDGTPQLNLRTYVRPAGSEDADGNENDAEDEDADVGVYFLSLDNGRRLAAAAGRRLFGLPVHHASMRVTRRDDQITFRSRRPGSPEAVFQARYRPTGTTYRAEPGTLEAFCVERFRYYFPASEDHRSGALQPGRTRDRVRVGRIDRDPWELRAVEATLRTNTLFEAAGLPTPTADPVVHYSPGFEMNVEPIETRRVSSAR
jgi:hypothetical protein